MEESESKKNVNTNKTVSAGSTSQIFIILVRRGFLVKLSTELFPIEKKYIALDIDK